MREVHRPFETFAHYKIGKGFATLAAYIDNIDVRVGISYCHPRDNINKGFGRCIAAARRDANSDFSFRFKRDGRKLREQLRAEFENFVTVSGHSLEHNVRSGAPPWVVYSLSKELRRRDYDNKTVELAYKHAPCCC